MSNNYKPKNKGLYRHYKGGVYHVIGLAMDTEAELEFVVIYKSLGNGGVFVRPLKQWSESVGDVLRFEYLGLVASAEAEE